MFNVPTKTFIAHTFHEAIPYWIKRWVFWRRDVTLRPLIQWDDDADLGVYMPDNKNRTQHVEEHDLKKVDS